MLFLPLCVSVCLSLHLLLRQLLAMDDFLFWALPGDEVASKCYEEYNVGNHDGVKERTLYTLLYMS